MYQIMLVGNVKNDTLYDQSLMETYSVLGPKCSFELNEAGSLSFTLEHGHPYINELEPLASYVIALDDGEEIFYGRVLHRSKPTLTGSVTFQCEGALSFLLDSEIPPYEKTSGGGHAKRHLSAEAFFRWCIEQHNAFVGNDQRRQFTIGTISADKKSTEDDYCITSYTQTKSAIESQILDVYGGFLRIRPKNGGGHYIDWIEDYDVLNPQAITMGVNLEDQTNESDGTNLFTVMRPLGKSGLTLPEDTIDVYSSEDIDKYGRIVKSIEFQTATTVEQLRTKANAYKNRIRKTLFVTSNIKKVDMHYLDGTSPKVRIGDRFTNIRGLVGASMVVSSLELDFEHPENDVMDLKNRKSLDPDLTPEGNGHGGKTMSGNRSGSKQLGQLYKYIQEIEDTLEISASTVNMHGTLLTQHYETIAQTANNFSRLSRKANSAINLLDKVKRKVFDNTYEIETIEGTGVFQNDQHITQVAGQFEVWTDSNGRQTVHLISGASLSVDDRNGVPIVVGTRLGDLTTRVTDVEEIVEEFQGSTLWTNADGITGISGEFEIVTHTETDENGNPVEVKELIVKNGGGFKLRRDGAEFGIYDEGNLDGGLMVRKINGQTQLKIQGNRVDISADDVHINATATLNTVTGHFVERWRWDTDEFGNRTKVTWLEYVADAGLMVTRLDNNGEQVTVGVYDEGNLTGGLMVTKINGQTVTHIKGDKILIGDVGSDDLESWAEGADVVVRNFAAYKAKIDNLTGQTLRESFVGAQLVKGSTVTAEGAFNFKDGSAGTLKNGHWRSLKFAASSSAGDLASASSIGEVLGEGSTGSINLYHSHSITVDNTTGDVTIGGPLTGSQGNFNIADTQFHQNRVSAVYVSSISAPELTTLTTVNSVVVTATPSNGVTANNRTATITIYEPENAVALSGFNTMQRCVEVKLDGVLVGRIRASVAYSDGQTAGINSVSVSSITAPELTTLTVTNGAITVTATPSSGIAANNRTASLTIAEASVALSGYSTSQDCVEVKLDNVIIGRIRAGTARTNGINSVTVSSITAPQLTTLTTATSITITGTPSNNIAANKKTATLTIYEPDNAVALQGFSTSQRCVEVKLDNVLIGRVRASKAYNDGQTTGVNSVTVSSITAPQLTTLTTVSGVTITATPSSNIAANKKTAGLTVYEPDNAVAISGYSTAQRCVEVKLDGTLICRIIATKAYSNGRTDGANSVTVASISAEQLTQNITRNPATITATPSNGIAANARSATITMVEERISGQDYVDVKLNEIIIGRMIPTTAIANAEAAGEDSVTINQTGWYNRNGNVQYSGYAVAGANGWTPTSRTIVMKASNGEIRTETLYVNTEASWDDGKKWVYVMIGGFHGTKMIMGEVELPGSGTWSFQSLGTGNQVTINFRICDKTYSTTRTATNGSIS